MARNDTKVHTRDARFPPTPDAPRNLGAARVAGLAFTQEDEVNLPKVLEDSKITARRISPRVSREQTASGVARVASRAPLLVINLFAAHDLQVVLHRKYGWHTARSNVRNVFVACIVDHTFERDVSALHNDMNRRHGGIAIAKKSRASVNGAVDRATMRTDSGVIFAVTRTAGVAGSGDAPARLASRLPLASRTQASPMAGHFVFMAVLLN